MFLDYFYLKHGHMCLKVLWGMHKTPSKYTHMVPPQKVKWHEREKKIVAGAKLNFQACWDSLLVNLDDTVSYGRKKKEKKRRGTITFFVLNPRQELS